MVIAPFKVVLVREQAKALRNPPRAFDELLRGLGKTVPDFASSVGAHAGVQLTS